MLLKDMKAVWRINITLLLMLIVGVLPSQAHASRVDTVSKETCQVYQDRASGYMRWRGLGSSKEEAFAKYKRYPSEFTFLNDYDRSVLDKAYGRKLSKDPFEQIDQRQAFADEIYQDCLPKMSQYLTQLEQADKNRQQRYVQVDFKCIAGFTCFVKDVNVSPPKGVSPTPFDISNSRTHATIRHYSGGVPAGRYQYYFVLDDKRMCMGEFYIDGKKQNVTVSVYNDCRLSDVHSY